MNNESHSRSGSLLQPSQLAELRQALIDEKQWLESRIELNEHNGLGDSLRSQTGELSAYDNHPGDLGSEVYERGKDIALNENAERHLTDVREALQRMEEGQYGLCRTCGAPIPYERLRAYPAAAYCVEHVPDPHASEQRPAEERLLTPPYGRTSLDELAEQNQFDGEDAWQIVESWGTSNTPAMAENPNVSNHYDEMEVEADENDGYVEAYESFLATDIYGRQVSVIRNRPYLDYMRSGEGEGLLEPEAPREPELE